MDEEALRKEFYSWFETVFVPRLQNEVSVLPHECPAEAWLESARRADRKTREDIIDLLENMPIGSHGQEDAIIRAIRIIRATIPDSPE